MPESQTQAQGKIEGVDGSVKFTVFGDPVPKERPRTVKGHTYTPERTRRHEEKIALVYKSRYHGDGFESGEPLRLVVDAYFKIAKGDSRVVKEGKLSGEIRPTIRPDADNVLKTVQDALNGLAYKDDSQIVESLARKWYSDEPRTEIYITRV